MIKITRFDTGYAECCGSTLGKEATLPNYGKMLYARHSPIRAIMFRIEMVIPSFVSVHFVRHKVGVEHFVQSMRDDKTTVKADRDTLVRHVMICNAEAVLNMAAKRLCGKAHAQTRATMQDIKFAMSSIDLALSYHMLPPCADAKCRELVSCKEEK